MDYHSTPLNHRRSFDHHTAFNDGMLDYHFSFDDCRPFYDGFSLDHRSVLDHRRALDDPLALGISAPVMPPPEITVGVAVTIVTLLESSDWIVRCLGNR
jgi:hypothetical protein